MKAGDKIIWDSCFGYDIGLFVKEISCGGECIIDLKGGIVTGNITVYKSEVLPYSQKNYNTMIKKYKYEKNYFEEEK